MSAAERRALILLLSLGVVGQGVRWWLTRPDEAPGDVQLLAALPPRSPAAHRDSILAFARPLGPDERIDADQATAAELARLPRVGLALAKRIVADREARGHSAALRVSTGCLGWAPDSWLPSARTLPSHGPPPQPSRCR